MKVVVVGLGVQASSAGVSRAPITWPASIPSTSMRSIAASRMFRSRITARPSAAFRWAETEILSYCLRHGKHVLVEKTTLDEIDRGDQRAREARPQQGRRLLYRL